MCDDDGVSFIVVATAAAPTAAAANADGMQYTEYIFINLLKCPFSVLSRQSTVECWVE